MMAEMNWELTSPLISYSPPLRFVPDIWNGPVSPLPRASIDAPACRSTPSNGVIGREQSRDVPVSVMSAPGVDAATAAMNRKAVPEAWMSRMVVLWFSRLLRACCIIIRSSQSLKRGLLDNEPAK